MDKGSISQRTSERSSLDNLGPFIDVYLSNCELWYSRQFHDIKSICDSFIKLKTGIDTSNTIDPNRQRLENKLRQNVMKSLSKGK